MEKVFSLMLLLATMLTFTACGGDDKDEPIDYNSQLWGTWVHEKSTTNENLGMTVSIESVWAFRTNGTCTWTIQSKLNGNVLQSRDIDAKYSYNGKELSLTYNGNTEKIAAVVTGNSLTIVTEEGNSMTHYKR